MTQFMTFLKKVFLMVPTDFHCLEIDEEAEIINLSFDSEFLNEKISFIFAFSKARKGYRLSA